MRYRQLVGLTGLLLGLLGAIGLDQARPVMAQTHPAEVKLTAADRLVQQGNQQFQTSQFEAAIASWSQALALLRANPNRLTESQALGNLGLAYGAMGDYPKAIDYHEQRLAIARAINDQYGEGQALGNLGVAYQLLSDYPRAIAYFEQSLGLGRSIQKPDLAGNALGNLGNIYIQLGQYDTAITYLTQHLTLAKTMHDRHGEGQAIGNLGWVYKLLGDYPKAVNYVEQRLAIMRELGDRAAESGSLNNLSAIYISQGNYAKAIDYAEQSLTIARSIKDISTESIILGNLGGIYDRLGNHRKAIEYQEVSLTIARQINDRNGEATSLNSLGLSYDALADYPRAIATYQTSLVIAREIKDRAGEGNTLGNLGLVYFNQGQYDQAIIHHEQSLAIAREIKDPEGESKSLGNLGLTYKAMGNFTKAIEYQKQALVIAQALSSPDSEGAARANLGITFYQSNRLSEAEPLLRSAIARFESMRTGLTDANKVSLADTQNLTYQFLQATLVQQNRLEAALEVAERGRGRAFAELLAMRLQNKSIAAIQKIAQAPDIAAIRRIAKTQNATLVEYTLVYGDLYIWVIKPNGEIKFHRSALDPKLSIGKLVANMRNEIGVRGRIAQVAQVTEPRFETGSETGNLTALYQLLIAPIAAELPSDPNQRVVFLPQGELFLVPFAALQDAQGKYLIEHHTISTAPSIQTLDLTRTKTQPVPANATALVVGDPTMPLFGGQALSALPGARAEAIAIAKILNTQPLMGNQATKAAVLTQMATANWVHLATHGLLDTVAGEVPGAIALAPSGKDSGLLSAGEIFDLKLTADLVVLSACDTGRGQITGDGVVGLSRSIVAAGVPSVVVSLWAVSDDSTSDLMRDFYRHLQTHPNKAQALRQAMLSTMQQYPDPSDWAAFSLIGASE
jgi:CHAT domain-containing protein